MKIDIKGAFIQTFMSGKPIYRNLDGKIHQENVPRTGSIHGKRWVSVGTIVKGSVWLHTSKCIMVLIDM